MPVKPRVAFVADALPFIGGAEKVLMAALELFPDAPIFSLIYNHKVFINTSIGSHPVVPSFLNRIPMAVTQYKKFFPLMPFAIRRFDLKSFDLILSFSYAVAHGVRTHPNQKHISYTYTPMRYAWRRTALNSAQSPGDSALNHLLHPFRKWDLSVIPGIDQLVSVSQWIANWVKRSYYRDSAIIYPPVEVGRFLPNPTRQEYFITVSRLVSHKRNELLIGAFNRLKLPLIVVGEGPERSVLERIAGSTIKFLGFLPDQAVADLLNAARAFVCASEEDFGIAAVEAQAAGCPIIAYAKGGVRETIILGETGLLFAEPTVESLIEAVLCFEQKFSSFHASRISKSVQHFNKNRFLSEFSDFVNKAG